jgi:hypothetical protein
MMSDNKPRLDPDSTFSFGVRELREVQLSHSLTLNAAPRKAASGKQSCDPYNSSGSFDRKKNWARVGKR